VRPNCKMGNGLACPRPCGRRLARRFVIGARLLPSPDIQGRKRSAGASLHRPLHPFGLVWRCQTLILALGLLIVFQEHTHAAADVSREPRIKAALLQWFPYYVKWPEDAFATTNAPLLIGILGPDPFRQALENLLDKKVDGRQVKVVRFESVADLSECHILYVNLPDRREVQRALTWARGKPILTVSDQDDFTQQGGMISLLRRKNHIKPHINNAAARRGGLVINSSLLTVSEITEP